MGNEASNNACESIVNGSNPRYTYSQPTPSQQLGWLFQKEEKARQEQYAETNRQLEAQNRARLSEPYQHPTSTYRPIQTTSISTPSPSFTTPTFDAKAIVLFLPVVLVLIAENVGHVKAVSAMTGKNLDDQMGTALMADGIATTLAGLGGGSGLSLIHI